MSFTRALLCAVCLQLVMATVAQTADRPSTQDTPSRGIRAIPWDQVGAKAGEGYHGDGLSVAATEGGARLDCVFQRLDGVATAEGLWLVSTVTNHAGERLRVVATAVGRIPEGGRGSPRALTLSGPEGNSGLAGTLALPGHGTVTVTGQTVRFTRPGLVEEYSVSMDGLRQDFVVPEKPVGEGPLQVQLAVTGARVEPAAYGAQLVLPQSGRRIAYNRLRATDATGKELPARIESKKPSALSPEPSAVALSVVVNDAGAVYPVRIDPTFSDANWISISPILPGADGPVYAAVMDSSNNLYIGGGFTVVGAVTAKYIAQWNGSSWSATGSGMNAPVRALAMSGTSLYAAGDFTTAGGAAAYHIAQWNGSSWSPLGPGMNDNVEALVVSGTNLYAGGYFRTATNSGNAAVTVNYIARWNGSSWSALGSGMNNPVCALLVAGGTLYAGGQFVRATNSGNAAITVNRIAQWNGSSWSALGSGLSSFVQALAVSGGTLYAGGSFVRATNSGNAAITVNYIAQWNGSSWSALGSGMNNVVYALAVSGGTLYAGGNFTKANGSTANSIAQWDGSSWSALGSGMNYIVYALAVSVGTLYAGGSFDYSGDSATPLNYIAQWDGSSWSPLGSGMDNYVQALAVSGGTLYGGGGFTRAGGNAANSIAQWDGGSWSPLGSGMNGNVNALAVSGSTVYAGGYFTTAGGNAANNVAQWDGSSWSPLGSGLNGAVEALAVSGNTLYAGGYFTTAGGNPAKYIAQWNGSSWSPLGLGMGESIQDPYVYALAVSGTNLYAGGNFTTAGGTNANSVACWNGSRWSPVPGITWFGQVYALAVSGGTLYAGGSFWLGSTYTYIAQWNGSSWSQLGSGVGGTVYALAVSGGTLYAGGDFNSAGGNWAYYIAQWDGNSWSPLGSGMDWDVYALAVSGNTLCVGGAFTYAGDKASAFAAEAVLVWPEFRSGPVRNADGRMTLDCSTGTNCSSRLYAAANLAVPVIWQPIYTNATGGLWQFTDTNATGNQARFYRLSTP